MFLRNFIYFVFIFNLNCVYCSLKNYTGHAVYKIYAKNLIQSFTDTFLEEDNAIVLSNGSIPLPKGLNKLWQGTDDSGNDFAVVYVEPNKNKRFKRDVNYQLLTNDLGSWINNNFERNDNHFRKNNFNIPRFQLNNNKNQNFKTFKNRLETSESNLNSFLNSNYGSVWNFIQSPLRSLQQFTSWNPIHQNDEEQYKNFNYPSESTFSIKHAEKENAPVFFSSYVPNFRLDIYHNLDEIYDYLEKLSISQKHIRVFTIGYSLESRPIKAIEIHQDLPNKNKKVVYLDGLIHAREWITTATLLNLIEQILIRKLEVNFLIVPVINVDGYVYTWSNDRLWRKNRRKTSTNGSFLNTIRTRFASERCNGVDLNRNFDSNFGGIGSSLNSCSELYAGTYPFSEPETASLASLIWDNKHRIKLFISLHSFGQLWAAPHSYTKNKSPHHDLHLSVLKEVQQVVYNVNNVLYKVGPLGSILYLGSGYSMDWCYDKLGIVHSYLIELRDKGEYGFLLPKEQILPVSFEVLEGIRVSIKRAY